MSVNAVISGTGETSFHDLPEYSDIGICVLAAEAALADAGIPISEVDGLLVQPPFFASPRYHILVSEALGIYTKTLCDSTSMGGASCGAQLQYAKWAVESGLCQNVLIVAGEKLRTVEMGGAEIMSESGAHNMDYEFPYGASVPSYYGLVAQRYYHDYGLEEDALHSIAVTARKHAALNPAALKRDPITLEDVANSPMIVSPLRRLECALVNDGGAAFVVSRKGASAKPAREISMLGIGQAQSYYHVGHLVEGDGPWPWSCPHRRGRRGQACLRTGWRHHRRPRCRRDL